MIFCVSVDGVDGAGKTTLIENLDKKYNIVTLPRFYCAGMVPQDKRERKNWFLSKDALFTTKIYISGYKLRLFTAREFKHGLHFKFSANSTNNLVAMDRGFLSLKAYSFAMLRKTGGLSGDAADKIISEYTNELDTLAGETIDLSILLFKDSQECLDKILNRRICDENERLLVSYQHEYYTRHIKELEGCTKLSVISPLASPEEIFKIVANKIEEYEKCTEIVTT